MTDKVRLIPHQVILVESIPPCDFCAMDEDIKLSEVPMGPYDFKTVMGPWAHGCYDHYRYHAAYPNLGTGMGQLWVTEDQVAWTELELAKRESRKARHGHA